MDASHEIGTGHFMRCLALADAISRRKGRVRFLCRRAPESLRALALARQHSVTMLAAAAVETSSDLAHAYWLGTSQPLDAEASAEALTTDGVDWLVADHYSLDHRWETPLRERASRVMVVDDLADRRHDCDVLLDQNLHPDMSARYFSRVPADCSLLLGPTYALLREEFRQARARLRKRAGRVGRILILMGGVDQSNLTALAMDAVAHLREEVAVDVVVGAQNLARAEIADACIRLGFQLHVQPDNMAELMAAADLSIGAAGSTAWERCCMGLPAICIVDAANQSPIASALDAAGAALDLGDKDRVTVEILRGAVESLIAQEGKLKDMSEAASALADGCGADRVAESLLERA